jgi:hypothetical protein
MQAPQSAALHFTDFAIQRDDSMKSMVSPFLSIAQ